MFTKGLLFLGGLALTVMKTEAVDMAVRAWGQTVDATDIYMAVTDGTSTSAFVAYPLTVGKTTTNTLTFDASVTDASTITQFLVGWFGPNRISVNGIRINKNSSPTSDVFCGFDQTCSVTSDEGCCVVTGTLESPSSGLCTGKDGTNTIVSADPCNGLMGMPDIFADMNDTMIDTTSDASGSGSGGDMASTQEPGSGVNSIRCNVTIATVYSIVVVGLMFMVNLW